MNRLQGGKLFGLSLLLASNLALAHAGHDHGGQPEAPPAAHQEKASVRFADVALLDQDGMPIRLEKDLVVPARRAWSGKYSAALLDTVDWCLRMDHLERPQSVFALQKALTGEKEPDYRGKAPLFDRMRGMLRRG